MKLHLGGPFGSAGVLSAGALIFYIFVHVLLRRLFGEKEIDRCIG